MKHFFLTLAFAFAALATASADNLSESILRHVASTLREYGDYEVRFTVSAESMGSTGGEYVVSGDRYRIRIRQQEQFSDGKNRYEIYEADREVVIDRADTKTHDIFTNPTRAFDFAPAEFESTYRGKEKVGRKEADVVRLTPRNAHAAQGIITLYLDATTGLPLQIDYDYQGEQIRVTLNRITPKQIDASTFVFDPARYADYEIIDFR